MNITTQLRTEAVKFYLSNRESLRNTARRFNVHYLSLYQWVKWFQDGGKENLIRRRVYRKPWNRFSKEITNKIMLLKENKPSLTVRKAKEILEKEGIKVSLKGVWHTWNRYGLAGVPHNKPTLSFNIAIFPETPEIKAGLNQAQDLLEKKQIKKAAEVLNDLPYCPSFEILNKIPDRFLSSRRQVEKFPWFFGKLSFPVYRNKMKLLREKLEKNELYYSSLRAGIEEVLALQWMGKPREMLSLINHLGQKLNRKGEPSLRISLFLLKGIAYSMLFKIKKARKCLSRCNKNIFNSFPFLNLDMVAFYASIADFKKAIFFAEQGLKRAPKESKKILHGHLAYLLSLAGHYRASFEFLKKIDKRTERMKLTEYLIHAQHLAGLGKLEEASALTQKILLETRKEGILSHLHAVSLIVAGIYAALGNKEKAKNFIKQYIPVLKKYKMKRDIEVCNALIRKNISRDALFFSPIHLISLIKKAADSLKEKDYKRAFNYALKNRLMGVFHRFIFFFPESVVSLLGKGKSTALPRSLLKLPIFNKEIPVFNVKFLGNLIVYKNQKYLKARLKPKDTAFLIYLCSEVTERGKFTRLDGVYRNFWPKSQNPAGNLSHLLVRIKKVLKIPGHLLTITRRYGLTSLLNEGVYLTTDYQEFKQISAQAKALQRTGEWGFARKEYLRAFKLFRGEPFKKMYDQWSEDMRHRILSELEAEAINFAKNCLAHNNKKDAKNVLEKVRKIIPDLAFRQV